MRLEWIEARLTGVEICFFSTRDRIMRDEKSQAFSNALSYYCDPQKYWHTLFCCIRPGERDLIFPQRWANWCRGWNKVISLVWRTEKYIHAVCFTGLQQLQRLIPQMKTITFDHWMRYKKKPFSTRRRLISFSPLRRVKIRTGSASVTVCMRAKIRRMVCIFVELKLISQPCSCACTWSSLTIGMTRRC